MFVLASEVARCICAGVTVQMFSDVEDVYDRLSDEHLVRLNKIVPVIPQHLVGEMINPESTSCIEIQWNATMGATIYIKRQNPHQFVNLQLDITD